MRGLATFPYMSKSLEVSNLAHDIASAVFRVAALVRHERLRKELEVVAVELVREIEPKAVDSLERLVCLTEAVGEISEVNAEVLCRELGNLRRMINTETAESISGVLNTVDLETIFNEKGVNTGKSGEEIRDQGKRQEAILGYIRKFPNGCRMRQLSAEFSNFSERTVRTDIQKLIGKGLVLKVGSKTGPFSYFRVVDSSNLQGGEVSLPASVTKEELFTL